MGPVNEGLLAFSVCKCYLHPDRKRTSEAVFLGRTAS